MPGFATGLAGDGFAGGLGFDATGLAGGGFADGVGFETTGLAGDGFADGAGFDATDGAGDFTGPFLMAASDTSVINTATAVKTAYAIILIRIVPPLFALLALTDGDYIMSGDVRGSGKIIFSAAGYPQPQGRTNGIFRPSCKTPESCGLRW